MSRNRGRFAALFRPPAACVLPTLATVNLPSFPLLLALALPGPVLAQAAQAAVPQAAINQALALVSEAAATLAPAGARVEVLPGTLDSRLRLAPCERIEAFLAKGAPFVRVPVRAEEVGGLGELITALGELRTLPCHLGELGGMDGFYAARLQRV